MSEAIRIHENDNVAVMVSAIGRGELLPAFGIHALQDIPQGHKIALRDLKHGEPVVRYGVELGNLVRDIPAGTWVVDDLFELPPSPALSDLKAGGKGAYPSRLPERRTWMGFEIPGYPYAGTRNILGISTTVQCVAGPLRVAVDRIRREILPKYPHVDDVSPLIHPYGCGVAIDAPDAYIPIRSIRNLIRNPNFGGEIMLVSLGCEKLTVDRLLSSEEIAPDNVIVLQECRGFSGMIDAICTLAEKKLAILDERRRTELPLSRLCIGTQCGGSDAFSGISANPSIGYAFDLLAAGGATVMFSEVTEVRDGVHLLAQRCSSQETVENLKREIGWYDAYLARGGADRSANPTPGNHAGGLSNIVEKAMGSIAKSGHAPICEVVGPGQIPSKGGLVFAATPASDIVCGPTQLASGITLQVFSTGRGTPYSLREAPVIKIATRHELLERWPDLFDVDAGFIITGEKTIPEVGMELYDMILDVASGRESEAEKLGLYNDLIIDNPAPIT